MAIIFGRKCMLNNIKDSPNIQFDGTFYVVPKIFLQLFTLFIQVNDHTLPALHILMTRKTETLYGGAILAIKIVECLTVPLWYKQQMTFLNP